MNFNIIGAGRLGSNIALALSKAKIALLQSICNLNLKSAQEACKKIASGNAVATIKELPAADITWITCNDDSIALVVKELSQQKQLKPGGVIIHCSGVLNSALLAPLKAQGCFVASFHPLKAFKTGQLEPTAFNQIHCVLEGDEQACHWLKHSFSQLGANIIPIDPEAKVSYHAAACIASNYLITLAATSEQLFLNAGIPAEQARLIMCNLMQGNIDNLKNTAAIAESLTGPLMRGDYETLALHLQAIENPVTKQLYKTAGLATLPLTQLSKEKKQQIIELMS